MATRATYQINGTTFYCHWDGYPEGAAHRFLNMLDALTKPETGTRHQVDAIEDRRGGEAFAFIRGNMDAEPTGGHDDHGDTQWRYTVTTDTADKMTIKVESTIFSSGVWKVRFVGDLIEWLDTMPDSRRKAVAMETEGYFKRAGYWTEGKVTRYATRNNAEAIAEAHERIAKTFGEGNPNVKVHEDGAKAWRAALA